MKIIPDVDFLIFDLGNVIVDIDYQHSLELIKKELPENHHDKTELFYLTDFHKKYEKGEIDSAKFRNEVRTYFEQDWSDEKVDDLWNSLLKEIPRERIDLISRLKDNYKLGILSNTNEIHIDAVYKMLNQNFALENFDSLFNHVFLSHEMGLSKPSAEIYHTMVNQLGTKPERVVFFDDLEANVKGAASIGIHAVHVTGPQVIFDYLKHA
ncbi:putative hydrolase of the HAD superfamily [Algoriphagus iocasae]|uniref:Putative hydrolase of the HAD superfamily n=1 Tax=Algoriphagus iocasae TaxID=1836499 RepID=A0A841MJD5_9BACT|nr:HAD family phosphatase [Algoriphagus iocasae]MBB6325439.1 putative hydrolase of the HAD superfamily [Algoriphagus iocasae]